MLKYFFLFIFIGLQVNAQEFDKAKLDSLFQLVETQNKGMGSFSIYKDGQEIYQNSFGMADVAKNQKINSETQFRIGSISKTFTATVIMQLVDENKLKLDDKLGKFFPKIQNADKITIEDLLRHQSGLFDIINDKSFSDWYAEPQTKEKMLARFEKNGTVFLPKEQTQYSNTNYILLSYIAESIDKKDFKEILTARIFKPLELKRTVFAKSEFSEKNFAFAYSYENSEWKKIESLTNLITAAGAGGVISTPSEINCFYDNLFSGKLVSENSLERMMDIQHGVGLGIMRIPINDKNGYGHEGAVDSYQSFVLYFPEDKVSMATTSSGFKGKIAPIFMDAVRIYFGKEMNFSNFKPELKINSKILKTYSGTYSGKTFPVDVRIYIEDGKLAAMADGKKYAIKAIEDTSFYSEELSVTLKFEPSERKMIIEQNGEVFELFKK